MREKKRILLVDDEADINRVTLFRLEKEGYEVIAVDNGEEALTQVRSEPNLVLLDLLMPDISGYEVCRRIKSDPRLKHIPVILFTASVVEYDKLFRKVEKLKAQDVVVKPYNWQELLLKIRKHIL